jgi:hypothetical protein
MSSLALADVLLAGWGGDRTIEVWGREEDAPRPVIALWRHSWREQIVRRSLQWASLPLVLPFSPRFTLR